MVTKAEQQWIDGEQRRAEARVLPHRDPVPAFRWWNPLTWFGPDDTEPQLLGCTLQQLVDECCRIVTIRSYDERTFAHIRLSNPIDVGTLCTVVHSLSKRLESAHQLNDRAMAVLNIMSELGIPPCGVDHSTPDGAVQWQKHAIAYVQAARNRTKEMTVALETLETLVVQLTRQLSMAEQFGGVARARFTDDGAWVTRGDRVYLGTAPEDILFVVDRLEAIDRETGVVFQLDEAQAVFAKRENARAWKRAQRNPSSSSPAATGSDPGISPSDGGTSGAQASGPARGDGAVKFDFLPLPMGGGLDV